MREMATDRNRRGQTMRTELAAASAFAAEVKGFLFYRGGRRLACISLSDPVGTAATTAAIRFALSRVASARCHSPENDSQELHRATSRPTEKCIDAGWTRRRFHAGRAGAGQNAWLPADHARSNYSTRGNSCDLLPERPVLRVDVRALIASPARTYFFPLRLPSNSNVTLELSR